MKNAAILMAGVSRYPEEAYQNLKEKVIEPLINLNYNVKIFTHTWETKTVIDQKWKINSDIEFEENDFKGSKKWYIKNSDLDVKKSIESIVPIETFVIESNLKYKEEFHKIINQLPPANMKTPYNLISFLYSRYQCGVLMEEYEHKTNTKFDLVIRHRTEALLDAKLTNKILNSSTSHLQLPQFYIDAFPDLTSISNRNHAKLVNDIYINILDIIKSQDIFDSHTLLKHVLEIKNIPYNITNEIKTIRK